MSESQAPEEPKLPTNTDLAQLRTDLAQVRNELARDRTGMAAERTMLAWIRTSLSLISFGFGIDRFFQYLQATEGGTGIDALSEERIIGLALIGLGVFGLGGAIVGHWRTLKNLEEQKDYRYIPSKSLGLTVAVVLLFVGLATFFPLILSGASLSELFRIDSVLFQNVAKFAVFLTVLVLGFELPLSEVRALWQMPSLLSRSLLSVVVLPPALVLLLLLVVDLPEPERVALVILVACPGPPLLSRRTAMAGARVSYTGSLQVTLALLSVLVVPATLLLADSVLFPGMVKIDALAVLKQVALVQLLPLGIGIGSRAALGTPADEVSGFLQTISNTVFVVFILLVLLASPQVLGALGGTSVAVAIALTVVGLVIGHLLGGPELDLRAGLAVSTIARNAGLALAIVTINRYPQAIPAIAAFILVGIIVGLPYNLVMKRKIAASSSTAA